MGTILKKNIDEFSRVKVWLRQTIKDHLTLKTENAKKSAKVQIDQINEQLEKEIELFKLKIENAKNSAKIQIDQINEQLEKEIELLQRASDSEIANVSFDDKLEPLVDKVNKLAENVACIPFLSSEP